MEASSCSEPVKKQRTANYSTDEKNVLFSMIMDYKSVIENKKNRRYYMEGKGGGVAEGCIKV